jgi:hypothetical protein
VAYLASQPCHYLTPVQFGSFAAVAERRIEQLHLRLGELGLEFDSLASWGESPDAPVSGVGGAGEETLCLEILDRTMGGLFGDAEDGEQFSDRNSGVATDEVEDAVMGSAQSAHGQDLVG